MNYTLIEDKILSQKTCDNLISHYTHLTNDVPSDFNFVGYRYCDISKNSKFYGDLIQASKEMYSKYVSLYPEIQASSKHYLNHFVFKHFKPGKNFKIWHCEHSSQYPKRVLNLTFYLSNHNTGTEFFNGDVVKSVKGRGILIPSSFTHTHRGQQCDMNLDRYIVTGYFNYE